MSDVVLDRTRRFLDYLAALARDLTTTPERDVRQAVAAAPIWPGQVPRHHGVLLGPGEDRTAWLVVRKVIEPPAPRLPGALVDEVDPVSVEDFVDGPRLRAPEPSVPEGMTPQSLDSDESTAWTAWQQVRRMLDDWVAAEWRPWVAKVQPARAARRLYSDLFGLHLFLQANQATHELAWGHSVLSWQVVGQAVLAPLLTTRMSIEVDEDDGSLRLVPERPCELELDALEGLGLPLIEELSGLRERLREAVPDPWLDGGLDQVNRQLVAPLGLDARLKDTDQVPAPASQPVLTPTWVLFARRRPVRHERFYRELAEVIDETGFLPEGVAAVWRTTPRLSGRSLPSVWTRRRAGRPLQTGRCCRWRPTRTRSGSSVSWPGLVG